MQSLINFFFLFGICVLAIYAIGINIFLYLVRMNTVGNQIILFFAVFVLAKLIANLFI